MQMFKFELNLARKGIIPIETEIDRYQERNSN